MARRVDFVFKEIRSEIASHFDQNENGQHIGDMIEGIAILAILICIYGFTNDVMVMSGRIQKDRAISYSSFTKILLEE